MAAPHFRIIQPKSYSTSYETARDNAIDKCTWEEIREISTVNLEFYDDANLEDCSFISPETLPSQKAFLSYQLGKIVNSQETPYIGVQWDIG